MDFDHSDKTRDLVQRLSAFMYEHVYPNESVFYEQVKAMGDNWVPAAITEELKPKAREAGLWNLFLPDSSLGAGLTNLEYSKPEHLYEVALFL